MNIQRVRTAEDHRAALAADEAYWGTPEDNEEDNKLDVLRYAIDELGRTQAQLAELLVSRSRASAVLSRRRAVTAEIIPKIAEAWRILADLLGRPNKIVHAA